MSYWNAKYTNEHGEYEITFASKSYEKTKAVEKVCHAVMDDVVKSPEDLTPFLRGWISVEEMLPDEAIRVLVRLNGINPPIGFPRMDTDRIVDGQWVRWRDLVTHWMPLPEPPEVCG